MIVGSALAQADGGFRWDAAVAALIGALAIQVGVNYANDVSDAARGADSAARIGPPRAVAEGLVTPRQMRRALVAAFAVAVLVGIYLTAIAGWVVVAIGGASIVAALGYTGGPFPYGYRGLGEVFVFVFFGLVATAGTRYVHDQMTPTGAWVAGAAMGLLAVAILVANNVRDLATDAAAGKRTLAVRLGRPVAVRLYQMALGAAFVVVVVGVATEVLPVGTLLALFAAVPAIPLVGSITRTTDGRGLIDILVRTARLQVIFAALFAAGAVL